MRTMVHAVVEYENDDYAKILKNEITNTSIKFHLNLGEKQKRFIYNFVTGEAESVEVVDTQGDKLKWLMDEYIGYAKENYPELFTG